MFPVFPGGIKNSRRFPVFLGVVDTLWKRTFQDKWHRLSQTRCPSCHLTKIVKELKGNIRSINQNAHLYNQA